MMRRIKVESSYDGGDQGFLNVFFPQHYSLSFVYNALQTSLLQSWNVPPFKERLAEIKVSRAATGISKEK